MRLGIKVTLTVALAILDTAHEQLDRSHSLIELRLALARCVANAKRLFQLVRRRGHSHVDLVAQQQERNVRELITRQ